MVILKINAATAAERGVGIETERGLWESGIYKLYKARFADEDEPGQQPEVPDTANDDNFLGEMNISKEKTAWEYRGGNLNADEQKEIADFILDYQPPDGVY